MKQTRAAAIAANQPWYKTGKPCKNGHIEARSTATMECVECRRLWAQKERQKVKALRQRFSGK